MKYNYLLINKFQSFSMVKQAGKPVYRKASPLGCKFTTIFENPNTYMSFLNSDMMILESAKSPYQNFALKQSARSDSPESDRADCCCTKIVGMYRRSTQGQIMRRALSISSISRRDRVRR